MPADFRRYNQLYQAVAPRVMATVATPPDAQGWCSLSLHAGASIDELHRAADDPARTLVVEVSPGFPRTFGLAAQRHAIHVDHIDVLVESDATPMAIEDAPPTDVDRAIAGFVSSLIVDGATIQTGIGGVPSMVASLLADGDGGDYGVRPNSQMRRWSSGYPPLPQNNLEKLCRKDVDNCLFLAESISKRFTINSKLSDPKFWQRKLAWQKVAKMR